MFIVYLLCRWESTRNYMGSEFDMCHILNLYWIILVISPLKLFPIKEKHFVRIM